MSSDSIEDRVRLVMSLATHSHRKFKQLEEWTGIGSDRWSAVSLGRQRPTAEMIETLCARFPEMTLWIATGRTDSENRQWNVHTALARRETDLFKVLKKQPVELTDADRLVLSSAHSLADGLSDSERKFARDMRAHIVALEDPGATIDRFESPIPSDGGLSVRRPAKKVGKTKIAHRGT